MTTPFARKQTMSGKSKSPSREPFRTTITLNYPSPPLHLNQRIGWRKEAKIKAELRELVGWLARGIPFMHHVSVKLIWVVNDHRTRDEDNPTPTLKVCCDALVDMDVVPDDKPAFMTKHMPVIEYRAGAKPHLELVIEEVRG
jgi:hypothetical protein